MREVGWLEGWDAYWYHRSGVRDTMRRELRIAVGERGDGRREEERVILRRGERAS